MWAAEGKSKFYRQTILLSHIPNRLFNVFMLEHGHNYQGRVELNSKQPSPELSNIVQPVAQLFHRLDGADMTQRADKRHKQLRKIVHDLVKAKLTHIMIYIPSYFDFIKIRNFMNTIKAKFVSIHEYVEPNEIKKGRKLFEQGEFSFMLFTGRR